MTGKRRQNLILIVLGALTAIGPFSIDMYLPGFSAIARDLRADASLVGFTLTSYTLGIGLGQLLVGPFLDRYGRKKPILAGLSAFVLASVGCAFAPSIHMLILFRFFLALGSCVTMVGANAIIRDLYSGKEIARALSIMMMVFGIAPIIAPTMGGIVISMAGWRAIFGLLTGIGLVVALAIHFVVPETRSRDDSVSLHPGKVMARYAVVLKKSHFLVFGAAGGLASAMVFCYITGAPAVFLDLFRFSPREFGLIFGANAIAVALSNLANRLFLRYLSPLRIMLLALCFQASTAVLLFAGVWYRFLGIPAIIVLIGLFVACLGFVFPNATALLLQAFSRNAGTAAALNGGLSMLMGTLASALVSYFYNGTGMPMTALFAILALAAFLLIGGYSRLKTEMQPSGQALSWDPYPPGQMKKMDKGKGKGKKWD